MAFSLGVELLNMRLRAQGGAGAAAPFDAADERSEMRTGEAVLRATRFIVARGLAESRAHGLYPCRSEDRGVRERPPARLDASDDGVARDGAPLAAVGAAVAVVAHHHVVVGGHDVRAPVLVAAEVRRDVAVVQRLGR